MAQILLIQGSNMNLLGIRQPEICGSTTAAELDRMLVDYAKAKASSLKFSTPIQKVNTLTAL